MQERIKSREELDKAWDDLDAKYTELIMQCDIAVWTLLSGAVAVPVVFMLCAWLLS